MGGGHSHDNESSYSNSNNILQSFPQAGVCARILFTLLRRNSVAGLIMSLFYIIHGSLHCTAYLRNNKDV